MANGGMQRGVYGRAESPYNADYLTAAFASGSSNGSGTATAAGFAAFGLGEETWSSGRAPASNNALAAYTPSRGVISVRGNWPLVPTMDVVVPHTRDIADMLELLDVIVADDTQTRGDFWRAQPWVDIPKSTALRPPSYTALTLEGALKGKRLGVPKMYIGRDGKAAKPIEVRASVLDLWRQAARDLEALGAEVMEVDFPVVSNYERDRPGAKTMAERGLVPEAFAEREIWDLCISGWDDFLRANADPVIPDLTAVDGPKIFPQPPGALPDRYGDDGFDLADYVTRARQGVTPFHDIPTMEDGLKGLEATRRIDFEDWLDEHKLDAVVLPTVADVGPADADVNEASAALAWRNGTWVANGNLVWRHLGIPTVTVPMGTMADIGMPVGLTFAGKAYDDVRLLQFAGDYERSAKRRSAPPRTPELPDDVFAARNGVPASNAPPLALALIVETKARGNLAEIAVAVELDAAAASVKVHVNGKLVAMRQSGVRFHGGILVPAAEHERIHSVWRGTYGSIVTAIVRLEDGRTAGAYAVTGGIG
jgi:amidase